MPDCKVCHQAYTAFQTTNAGSDCFYELFVRHGEQMGQSYGYYVYYRSKVDLPWEDVPEAAVRDGHLLKVDLYNVEFVEGISPDEYFAKMWE